MFERYTERARRVIFFACQEANRFGSKAIETEHFLLGLLREDGNLTNRFLPFASSAESVRVEIESRLIFREKAATSIDLPLSNECKRILAYSAEEAERLNQRHIGTEHLLLGILREQNCVAAQVLDQIGLKLQALREELAHAPRQQSPVISEELRPLLSLFNNPVLPKSGVVRDADTAERIAEAIWQPLYGAETIASQRPLHTELKYNVWIVTGSYAPEAALFAFILQADGRILSVGRGLENL